jgi:2'-5' RNA ligase
VTAGEYRVFVGAFPGGDVADRIQAVRRQHDPKTARITPPHVTLAGTYWRHGPATAENEADAVARLHAVEPRLRAFDLVMGGVRTFLPVSPVVFLGIEATPGLLAARQVLLEAMGMDKHGSRFTPHLTLAMRMDAPQAQALAEELQRGDWHAGRWAIPMAELLLMQRGPGDPAWRAIARLQLAA